MNLLRPRMLAICVFMSCCLAGCGDDTVVKPPLDDPLPPGDNVALRWNDATLLAIRQLKPGPPMAARALAIVHTSMFDAWAAYDDRAVGTRLGGSLRRAPADRLPGRTAKAVSYAAHRALVDLFPARTAAFDSVLTVLGYTLPATTPVAESPEDVGRRAANAVLAYRHADGSNQLGDLNASGIAYADYTGYTAANPAVTLTTPTGSCPFPDRWAPLTYVDAIGATVTPAFLAPHWGNVVPFALTRDGQLRPPPPALYGTPRFAEEAAEVVAISAALTDSTKAIAEYWADGPKSETPPGHWCVLAQNVSRRDHHTLAEDVRMFFALTNAVFDAGIATWDAKRVYDTCRPATAVRMLYAGQTIQAWGGPGLGTREIDGAMWLPYQPTTFPTPPFPEYTSGHSAFSMAAATVLKAFTGSDAFEFAYTMAPGSFKAETGPAQAVTLSVHSFSEAAQQAGISRLYGGIHFREANEQGLLVGARAGAQAWAKARSYWEGTASAMPALALRR